MSTRGKAVSSEPDNKISICRLCALVSGSKSFIPLYLNKEPQVTTKEINQLVPNVVSSYLVRDSFRISRVIFVIFVFPDIT